MSWRLLTRAEIASEYPKCKTIIAAAALTNDEGELYSDSCFTLHNDGTMVLPPVELPVADLLVMIDTLKRASAVTIADEVVTAFAAHREPSAPA